jgi:predicted amidohydrolase
MTTCGGVAQFAPRIGKVEANTARCLEWIDRAAAAGVELLVLPECALTGYMFGSRDAAEQAAHQAAELLPGLAEACRRHRIHLVVGTLAVDGGALRNRAVLITADGVAHGYDKTHLPLLGADRWVRAGAGPLLPLDTAIGCVGLEVCYDLRFPEVTRCLALAGAEIIAHPTNWGMIAADTNAGFITRARAFESRVFVLTANRTGTEGSITFCGRSQIIGLDGEVLAMAGEREDALLCAQLEPTRARHKRLVPDPGVYEMELFGDRRPELYGALM